MDSINIKDIAISKELDANAMSEVKGGFGTTATVGSGETIPAGDYETGGNTGKGWEEWEPRPHNPQTPKPKPEPTAKLSYGNPLSYFRGFSLFNF